MNDKTAQLLQAFCLRPHAPLLLIGQETMGLSICKQFLIDKLLDNAHRNNIIMIEPDEGASLGIEQVRYLKQALMTKTQHTNNMITRLAFITHLEKATPEAQNALLKLLEEPVEGTVLIIHTTDKKSIASTILSRVFSVPLLPLSKPQVEELALAKKLEPAEIEKLYVMSQGEKDIVDAMLDNRASAQNAMDIAKLFLSKQPHERLLLLKDYSTSSALASLLETLELLCGVGIHHASGVQMKRWKDMLKDIREIKHLLRRNVMPKLLFLRLCVSL